MYAAHSQTKYCVYTLFVLKKNKNFQTKLCSLRIQVFIAKATIFNLRCLNEVLNCEMNCHTMSTQPQLININSRS